MSLARVSIAQTNDKIKADFSDHRQINALTEDLRRPSPKFEVGDVATDFEFSCRVNMPIWDSPDSPLPAPESRAFTPQVPPTEPASSTTSRWRETRQVLSQLGPERKNNKTTWLRVGQALHAEHGANGLGLWQEWTTLVDAPSAIYTAEDCQAYFAKFGDTSTFSFGTLQRWATEDQAGGYWGANQISTENESQNLAEQRANALQDFDESHDASSSEFAENLDFGQRLVATQAWRLNYQHYGNCFGLSPDILYWANLGAQFTLLKDERDASYYDKEPKKMRKRPIGKGWQGRPHTAQQAQAHLETGKGVGVLCGRHSNGLICLDIDEIGLDKALEVLPMLAYMPYVAHAAKPNRGKFFFYAPLGTPNRSYSIKIDGKRVIFFEILSDGKQAVIPPSLHPSDAQYTLFNADCTVPRLTSEQIESMWEALLSIAPVDKVKEAKRASREAAKATKEAKKAKWEAQRAKREHSQGVDFDTFDWDAFTTLIADNFDLLSYAEANFSGQTKALRDGGIRIIGNGGLIVSGDQWCIHSENSDNGGKVAGGGCFQLVSYVLFGTDDAKANWPEVLKEAAKEAGVSWPTFKQQEKQASHHFIPDTPKWVIEFARTLKIELVALTLHEVIQTTELGLKYISEVYDINSLGPGLWVIQAPTERGKTTATTEGIKNFLIIAVPTQSLARQVEKDKGLQAIYENIEPVFGAVNRFVSTYDSVGKIIARAAKKGIDISHWTLVIDECHHLASDAYRKEAIESLGQCMKQFERVIALSATPTPVVPFFKGAPLIRFTAPQIEKPLYFATCTDYVNAIYQALREAPRCICHLNDKTAIKALIEELALRGIKGLEFTSDSKESEHHCNMITNQAMPDCDVLFVTSLYDDGYNFFDKDPYILLITARSSPSPEQIEQISARLRKQRPIKTILVSKAYKSKQAGDTPLKVLYPTFDYARTLNRELETATELAAIENEAHRKRVELLKRTEPTMTEQQLVNELVPKQLGQDGAYRGLKWDGTQYVADSLGVQMATFAKWRHACNANRDLMIHALKPYGFVHAGDWQIKEDKKETAQSRARQAVSKERLSEERREAVAEHLTKMQGFAHAELILTNQGNHGHTSAEYEAAGLMMALVESGITDECAKELILNSTMTAHAVASLRGKIRLQRIRLGLQETGRYLGADVGFYRKLFEIVQIGDVLTHEKLDKIYGRIFADNESVAARLAYSSHDPDKQKAKRVRLINAAFETKRIKIWNDEHTKRIDVYEVIGLSPIEVTFEAVAQEATIRTDMVSCATEATATEAVAQEGAIRTDMGSRATEATATEASETISQLAMNLLAVPAQRADTVSKGAFFGQKTNLITGLGSGATTEPNFDDDGFQDDEHDETFLFDSWKVNDFVYQPTPANPYGW